MYVWEGVSVEFPDELKGIELEMGIDEAGRGPALGPMVYSGAIAPNKYEWPKDVDDSKKLTAEQREEIFDEIKKLPVGFAVRVISAEEISAKQTALVNPPISLNTVSHHAARDLVQAFLDKGLNIKALYVDTVGIAESYQDWLQDKFPNIKVTVRAKADATYKVVGAASICAKVTRDRLLADFKFEEPGLEISHDWGSGYPSDPKTSNWLETNFDPVFGYPSVARFDWKPIKMMFENNKMTADFELPDPHILDSPFFATRGLKQFHASSK
ncbi:ribonuclease HII family protein [Trichomonas vaginalis G3]|uniref:Ribonuclease n=1 Tax=Trichomonas vaginalis (strain ATCC PRA-98 / G3) TaxID=412133 RepID=A2DUE3_TRIV3|nr:RNA-DNA hybrid ribonuclease protein [Trichomonas vaginalis G3]EAY15981.1 ribonuclease HII family protein [Trichomonas vaginalis G3]KAI5523616.1 RNA-DNA hybrid ribonuclease protein [Trichomonas vaginalis G3]|eukprot:XP_001328204.1 ribonuclease HII family protein [Trichomonas vaginalis G3]